MRLTRWTAKFGLGLGSVVFALLLAEIGLRVLAPQLRVTQSGIYEYDEHRGYRLKKNHREERPWPGRPAWLVSVNEYGHRDGPLESDPDLRILAIGDSHTFGDGVSQDDSYPAQLEAKLRQRTGLRVEVVNGGVGAYGWIEQYEVLREFFAGHRVDAVLWQTGWNDIGDNGMGVPKYMIDPKGNLITIKGRVRPGGFGAWGMKTKPISSLEMFALRHSHAATLMIGFWSRFLWKIRGDEIQAEIDTYKWKVSEEALPRILDLAKEKNCPVFVILHPGIRPDALDQQAETHARIRSMFTDRGVPVLDLVPLLRDTENAEALYIPEDVHFSAQGYDWMTDHIHAFLEPILQSVDR